MYDTTDKKSFEDVNYWMDELGEKAPKNIEIAIVGNKIDLNEKEEVAYSRLSETALKYKCLYSNVSAKKNIGITDVF